MTSFREEFFGCRFHRDKVIRNCKSCGGVRSKPAPKTGSPAEPSPEALGTRNQLSAASTPLPRIDEGVPTRAISEKIEGFAPGVALSVVAALKPQISELQMRVASLQHAASNPSDKTGPAQGLSASDVAVAVTAALSPRFDDLEKQAAAAYATKMSMMPPTEDSPQAPDQDLTSALVKELLPEISDVLETSLGEALTPRLPELGQYSQHITSKSSNIRFRRSSTASGSSISLEASSERSQEGPVRSERTVEQMQASDSEASGGERPMLLKRTTHGLSNASSLGTIGKVKPRASRSQNKLPKKAFVVNFRRLVEVQKILAILHEFINSTGIATLTLVAAANWSQLAFSIFFVILALALFAVHEMRYDGMDIGDYKSLVELLEDDDGECRGTEIHNPNRLLKGLTLCNGRSRRRMAFITSFFGFAICMLLWVNIFCFWASSTAPSEKWLGVFYGDDMETQAASTLVGTAMVAFHVAFEWIYWRETQCVMPVDADGESALDPRAEGSGVPIQYRWFGLPSMWFTSQRACDDLRLWITYCCWETCDVKAKIFPEEMALFALNPHGASYLRKTLSSAKLFGMAKDEFLTRDKKPNAPPGPPRPVNPDEEPEELGLDFVLFDNASEWFLQPEEGYSGSMMRLLTRDLIEEPGTP